MKSSESPIEIYLLTVIVATVFFATLWFVVQNHFYQIFNSAGTLKYLKNYAGSEAAAFTFILGLPIALGSSIALVVLAKATVDATRAGPQHENSKFIIEQIRKNDDLFIPLVQLFNDLPYKMDYMNSKLKAGIVEGYPLSKDINELRNGDESSNYQEFDIQTSEDQQQFDNDERERATALDRYDMFIDVRDVKNTFDRFAADFSETYRKISQGIHRIIEDPIARDMLETSIHRNKKKLWLPMLMLSDESKISIYLYKKFLYESKLNGSKLKFTEFQTEALRVSIYDVEYYNDVPFYSREMPFAKTLYLLGFGRGRVLQEKEVAGLVDTEPYKTCSDSKGNIHLAVAFLYDLLIIIPDEIVTFDTMKNLFLSSYLSLQNLEEKRLRKYAEIYSPRRRLEPQWLGVLSKL
ncbi:hypothetical protein [Acidiphilium acidophilum]|uniref:hypothetical protein n=1 Tax=Acidiphilium acidophilum TaxID=76588 RepID=UPI002E8E7677|nr:hypothetical protein [Acidiphilium acidophilum]